jgi:single-strand DNA-binding protein
MTYTGRIVWIGQTKQVTDKFAIREFVLTDGKDTYPQEVKMQVTQKNCPLLDNYNVGDEITVHINLKGRRYERDGQPNWYTTVEAWRFEAKSAGNTKGAEPDYTSAFDNLPF